MDTTPGLDTIDSSNMRRGITMESFMEGDADGGDGGGDGGIGGGGDVSGVAGDAGDVGDIGGDGDAGGDEATGPGDVMLD